MSTFLLDRGHNNRYIMPVSKIVTPVHATLTRTSVLDQILQSPRFYIMTRCFDIQFSLSVIFAHGKAISPKRFVWGLVMVRGY